MLTNLHAEKIPLDTASRCILFLGGILGRTWRVSLSDPAGLDPFHDGDRGRIYVFWHAHLLALSYLFRHTGKIAVVSESRDGRRAAAVAQRWGHAVILGSSSHGGMLVLRACARDLRNGKNIALTPDGPRGPAETVKPGVAQISLISGAPVVPVILVPRHSWRLRSWDRFCIPMPFTRICVRLGEPIHPQISSREKEPAAHLLARIQKALTC
ncbi:MAG: lysophospholipid acyltransferase family protein [Chitinispirillaceae bacterium]|nr:lysophospholipid acyltransferase family protein [Chitinispirillaceae bacterium]